MVPARMYTALALVSGAALALALSLTRLLSVALWYPFAYVALGVATLGLGGAAVLLALSPALRHRDPERFLGSAALGAAVFTLGGYPLWNALPLAPMSIAREPLQLLWILAAVVLLALPFLAVGLFVAKCFAHHPESAPRLYAADLAGAAAGTVLYAMAVPGVGGIGTLVFAGAGFALASLLIHPGSVHRRAAMALGITVLVASAGRVEEQVPLRITPNKLMGSSAAQGFERRIYWSTSSAIEVIRSPQGPLLVIDGGTALTRAPYGRGPVGPQKPQPPEGLRAIPYRLGPGEQTLILGSGGGMEVRAALGAGSKRVVALEVSGAINRLVTTVLSGPLGGLFSLPGVELHTAEARSFLAALPAEERFDAIVGFHTISNAASATGAMSLAEGYLLTVEAMEALLGRLTPDGVLLLSRPESQMGRLVALLAEAWHRGGGHPEELARRVAIVTQENDTPAFMAALVLRQSGWDPESIATLRSLTPGRVIYTPGSSHDDVSQFYQAVLRGQLTRARELQAALPYASSSLRLATDDRPFFNLHREWHEISLQDLLATLGAEDKGRDRLEDLPVGQVAVVAFLGALLLACAALTWPILRRMGQAGMQTWEAGRLAALFGAYGFGFMLTEVVLIQILTRIVGEPAWSLVVVLGGMLLMSGVGAMVLSGRLGWLPQKSTAVAAVVVLAVSLGAESAVNAAASWPFAGRVVMAALWVGAVGFFLGAPFPASLYTLHTSADAQLRVAWAWAQNSVFSVIGSVGALIASSALGFRMAAALAVLSYGTAWLLLRSPAPRAQPSATPGMG